MPEDPQFSCSVVIPTHNAEKTLSEQLRALSQQTSLNFEVIVVANNCSDRSAQIATSFIEKLPGLKIIEANEQAGASYARNIGSRAATCPRILFCDADDVVSEEWVESMNCGLDKFDVVGGILDTHRLNDRPAWELLPELPTTELPTSMKYQPYAFAGNMGCHRAVLERVNGFDEEYSGHEETRFSWQAQNCGFKLGVAPGAVIYYRLSDDIRAVVRNRFSSGKSYAQLYKAHRAEGIPRGSARHEIKVIGKFILSGPIEFQRGTGRVWLSGAAWTAGRWYGGVKYGVRPPL